MGLRDDNHDEDEVLGENEGAVRPEEHRSHTEPQEQREVPRRPAGNNRYTRPTNNQTRSENQEKKVNQPYNFRNDAPLLSLNSAAGDVAKFVEITKTIQEQNKTVLSMNGNLQWVVTPASGKDTQMKLDAAIIAARVADSGDIYAYTAIFVGNTVMPKQPIQISRDTTVKFTTTANDQYEAEGYQESLNALIERADPSFNGEVFHLGAFPMLGEKPTDAELERVSGAIINQVVYSITANMNVSDFSIEALDLRNNDLLANIAFHQGDIADPVTDLPHRADIVVDLMVAPRDERRGGVVNVLSERESTQLVGLIGHVDLYYKGPEEETSSFFARSKKKDEIDTHIYGANLVITGLNCNPIPEYLIFALGQIPALMTEPALVQGLRPVSGKGSLRTANALTYELPGDWKELPDALSDGQWEDLVANVIREGSQVTTLQIPRSSITSPLMRALVDACDPTNPARKDAVDILIAAADNVTGGRFSQSMNVADLYDVGTLRDIPQLLGTWTDEQGHKRDLREIGYYEILTNFGLKSPQIVEDYDRCLADDRIDVQIRMDQIEKIVDDFTGGQYQIVDRADVVEINSRWLFGLTSAMSAAGMTVTADGISQDVRNSRRGYTSRYESNGYDGAGFRTRGRSSYGFGNR